MDDRRTMNPRWSRRNMLKAGAAAGAGAFFGFPRPGLAAIPDQFDGSKFQLAAPEPNPKRGGVLRYGITGRLPHFDLHQSGTINKERHIRGGRPTVRAALYMATLVATRRDPVIKAHYEHLKSRGKPKKVALVACMRKRLNYMTSLLSKKKEPTPHQNP